MGALSHDRVRRRAARRAALLRACAIAGLLGQPALSAPPTIPQPAAAGPPGRGAAASGESAIFPLVAEKPALSSFGARGRSQPQIGSPLLAPGLKADRGLFDIEVPAPSSASGARQQGVKGAAVGAGELPPRPRPMPHGQELDGLLVGGRAIAPASHAQVESGAIVLSADHSPTPAASNATAAPPPPNTAAPIHTEGKPAPAPPPPPPASAGNGSGSGQGNGAPNDAPPPPAPPPGNANPGNGQGGPDSTAPPAPPPAPAEGNGNANNGSSGGPPDTSAPPAPPPPPPAEGDGNANNGSSGGPPDTSPPPAPPT